jgi:hypothetical protein
MAASSMPDDSGPRREPVETTPADRQPARAPAWEQVEAGRYRPLRIRGSFPGRELG